MAASESMTAARTTIVQKVDLPEDFHDLVEQRQALVETIKSFTEEKDIISEQIKAALAGMGVKEVKTVKWSVKMSESERKTIDEKMLLMNGVNAAVIAVSKKVTTVVSLTVHEIKEEKEGK